MLNRAFHLSSTLESFKSECNHLKVVFTNLKYPESLIESIIAHFVTLVRSESPEVQVQSTNENTIHRVVFPLKDDFQSVLRSLRTHMFINIITAHSMECESMLFIKNHIPYL